MIFRSKNTVNFSIGRGEIYLFIYPSIYPFIKQPPQPTNYSFTRRLLIAAFFEDILHLDNKSRSSFSSSLSSSFSLSPPSSTPTLGACALRKKIETISFHFKAKGRRFLSLSTLKSERLKAVSLPAGAGVLGSILGISVMIELWDVYVYMEIGRKGR